MTQARSVLSLILLFFCSLALAQKPDATQPSGPPIKWQSGPLTARLGDVATLQVPAGMRFTDGTGARRLLELNEDPPSGMEVGALTPVPSDDKTSGSYLVLFEFHETGYVSDQDKSTLDPNALLDSIKKGTEEANDERRKKGWTPFHVTGWSTPPHYDDATKNLTWAILGQDEAAKADSQTVNYEVRILGRRGLMRATLILAPDQLDAVLPSFNGILQGFAYNPGSRYAEFVKGDKVAGYGLAALIAGGAATVAVKTGFFAKILALLAGLWKVIAVAFAAVAARFRRIVDAIRNRFRPKRADRPALDEPRDNE